VRPLSLISRSLVAVAAIISTGGFATGGMATGDSRTLQFVVTRNGNQIGTSTFHLLQNGSQVVAENVTHIRVQFAYLTVYYYDQHENERWEGSRLLAMDAVTDDNGTVHKVTAAQNGNALSVDADGRISKVNAAAVPVSLWNPSVLQRTLALNPRDGSVAPISVVDRGQEKLELHGKTTAAHHYLVKAGFSEDVWYDEQQRLVQVELHVGDGSQIQYRLG
jgi:hypothetical protein